MTSGKSPGGFEEFPALAYPDGALMALRARSQPALAEASVWQLGNELLARIERNELPPIDDPIAWLGSMLGWTLRKRLDVHANRFARRRYLDLYGTLYSHCVPRPPIEGATWVDLGCGGMNPLGLLTVFLALGARRGIGVDLDPVRDEDLAARAIADAAATMILDPSGIAWDYKIDAQQVLRNLAGLDLRRLHRGELAGVGDRLAFRNCSIYDMAIGQGEADVVISNAFLEHIPDVARGVREIARITKPGGYSVHNIDMTDHRRYANAAGPLDFLTEASSSPILHHSNRLRLSDFAAIFEAAGFEIAGSRAHYPVEVPADLRQRMVEPFRSKAQQDLEAGVVVLVARRR
ncbi:MAG: methyltransferase domain-containing protein [Planctomycetota bacterium]